MSVGRKQLYLISYRLCSTNHRNNLPRLKSSDSNVISQDGFGFLKKIQEEVRDSSAT